MERGPSPPYPKAPRTLLQATRTDAHTPTHTHTQMHRQTDTHQIHEDTRRHAKSLSLPSGRPAKKDSYCFALPVHLLRQVSAQLFNDRVLVPKAVFFLMFYNVFCIGAVPEQLRLQDGSRDPKMLPKWWPRWSMLAPRRGQDAPRWVQDGSCWRQDAPR